jgi:hypothetical protein
VLGAAVAVEHIDEIVAAELRCRLENDAEVPRGARCLTPVSLGALTRGAHSDDSQSHNCYMDTPITRTNLRYQVCCLHVHRPWRLGMPTLETGSAVGCDRKHMPVRIQVTLFTRLQRFRVYRSRAT